MFHLADLSCAEDSSSGSNLEKRNLTQTATVIVLSSTSTSVVSTVTITLSKISLLENDETVDWVDTEGFTFAILV